MQESKPHIDLLVAGARQLIYFSDQTGDNMSHSPELQIVSKGHVGISGEQVVVIGSESEVAANGVLDSETRVVEAGNCVVTPGLVDSHTHPVFHATREIEFELRCKGRTYEEIAASGGGIQSSVASVRQASKTELKEIVRERVRRFISLGTTTIEAKSGYGLNMEDEIKSLEIINELGDEEELDIIPTFLGAHEIPIEFRDNRRGYISLLIKEMIPEVASRRLAEFCDIFCEKNVYTIKEAREILRAARSSGLKLKLHADQLHLTGATRLGIELDAVSADHLEKIDQSGVDALANSRTVAGLLPGSVFFLGSHDYPPARKLIDAGATVCLATDFNPGSSMTQSLPMMMTLGCLFMGMTPDETLGAVTIHGAASINREDTIGNLLPGYQADLVLWNAEDYRQIPYYFGVNLVDKVIKKGRVVFQ